MPTAHRLCQPLRTARLVFCLTMCGLLIVFWVRSYHMSDKLFGALPGVLFGVDSLRGKLGMVAFAESLEHTWNGRWELRSEPDHLSRFSFGHVAEMPLISTLGIRWSFFRYGLNFIAPYWVFVLLTASPFIVRVLRRPYRFSLRAFMIAATFIALVGAGIVAALR